MPEKKEPVHVGDEFTSSRPGLYSSPRPGGSARRRPQSPSTGTRAMSTKPRQSARSGLSMLRRARSLDDRAVARMAYTASSICPVQRAQVTSPRPAKTSSPACKRLVAGHCPSGAGGASPPTSTSSTRPFRTAQITSSCFVLMPSLSCMRLMVFRTVTVLLPLSAAISM